MKNDYESFQKAISHINDCEDSTQLILAHYILSGLVDKTAKSKGVGK